VTKLIASFLDDLTSDKEDSKEWELDTEGKKQNIDSLRSKIFKESRPWPIVFIENGGGVSIKNRRSPNNETSLDNLLKAMTDLVSKCPCIHGRTMASIWNGMSSMNFTWVMLSHVDGV
jgi:hypothetical protein